MLGIQSQVLILCGKHFTERPPYPSLMYNIYIFLPPAPIRTLHEILLICLLFFRLDPSFSQRSVTPSAARVRKVTSRTRGEAGKVDQRLRAFVLFQGTWVCTYMGEISRVTPVPGDLCHLLTSSLGTRHIHGAHTYT